MCTCLLLYIGIHDNIKDCIGHFEQANSSKPLEYPSIIRFLHYFEAIFDQKVKSSAICQLKKIAISGFPTNSGLG